MTGWVFTFGHGQRLRSTSSDGRATIHQFGADLGIGWPLHDRYVVITLDHDEGRDLMCAIFGQCWSMEYEAGPKTDDMIEEYDLRELDITEPLEEIAGTFGHKLADAARRALDARRAREPFAEILDAQCEAGHPTTGARCRLPAGHPGLHIGYGVEAEVIAGEYVNPGDDTVNGAWST